MKKIILLLLVSLIVYANFFSEKARLDREVDHLCAIDGGIRVYETVKLPADKFDKEGRINFYYPTQGENALGLEYIFKLNIYDYKKGDPGSQGPQELSMRRDYFMIIRKSDMKLLGEFVLYSRVGGDLPGPWVPSSHRCPGFEESSGKLIHRIFVQSKEMIEE